MRLKAFQAFGTSTEGIDNTSLGRYIGCYPELRRQKSFRLSGLLQKGLIILLWVDTQGVTMG